MKKIFAIFILSTLSFVSGAFVLAQDNNPANTQGIQDLLQKVAEDSVCVPESTNSIDPLTGQSNAAICTPVKKSDGIYFTPNVDIPGFFEGTQQITPNTIGLYINAVYKYGAGLAGVLAMFMIVFAAWQWIIAAGNSGKIENAKDTIISALIGLALLFGGYLLLSQISYRLVEMKSLSITPITVRNLGVDNSCAGLLKDACEAKADCYWSVIENRCGANSACNIDMDLAFSKKATNRLLCCGDQFALAGDFANTCALVCGQEYADETGTDLEPCKEESCGAMDNQETSCKRFPGLCEWDEDDNTCDNYGGQRGNDGDDCDDPTDCLPGFCCDVDYLSANDCRPVGDPEANNCMPAIAPITNCANINSCADYQNSNHCLQNTCSSTVGDCRWDDDWPQGCKSISSGSCGGNGECLTTPEENSNNSVYCCCETSTPDSCVDRYSCGENCQTGY